VVGLVVVAGRSSAGTSYAMVAWGDADTIVARIGEHLDAGADHVAVQVLLGEKRGVPDEQWRQLAAPLSELNTRR
jgi:hypothetical protein